jgi:Carboxypeptidase regulatory-like domain
MRNGTRSILPLILVVSGVLIIGSGACLGQNTDSGDLRGTATDPTGAIIPGVTVTLLDIDKGVTRTYTTDGAGLYDTGAIPEDHYKLTFSKDGFETLVRGPVTVFLGIQTVDAKMRVGAVSQQIVVNTDVPMLQTESGAQEGTLESSYMDELPQYGSQNGGGADWENFVVLMPGAAGAPENANNALNPGTIASINGNLPFASVLQDGATTTLPMSQNSDVTIFDTTAEVKVSATAFSAQYGVGDIVYNQITKSGTNSFHGSGYDYIENNMFNSAPYNFGSPYTVPVLHFNDFGGNVGGPVIKKKVFFFFDYDRTIDHGGASTGFSTEPTPAMMSGDFTGMPTLYDPTTQVIKTSGMCTYTDGAPSVTATASSPCVQRTSFASEYGNGNKIPSTMISPVAQAFQKLFPTSNVTGELVPGKGYYQNNFAYQVPSTNPFIKWFGRLDYDVTPNNRLTLTETESDNPGVNLSEGICPVNCFSGDVSRDNAAVSDVWTIGSHFINEARMGFTDQLNFFVPYTLGKDYPQMLGLQLAEANVMPNLTVNNFDGNLASGTNAVYKEMLFDPSDVATLIRGRHVIHFGGEFLINRADSTAWGNINAGSFTFAGTYTSQGGSLTTTYDGFSYADFLLGQTQQWSAGVTPEFGGRWKGPQFFVQDDWKFKPNLTVNLGIRYEIMTGWHEVKGNEAVWDPSVQNFNVSTSTINGLAPGAPVLGGMWYGFVGQNGRLSLQSPKYDIVMPRAGFSWQIRPNTVIRGGIGIYTSTWSEDTYGAGMGSAFGSSGSLNDTATTNGLCPVVSLNSTLSTPNTQDPGCGLISGGFNYNSKTVAQAYVTSPTTPWAQNGNNPSYNEYQTPVPTNYQYSLTVEREFLKDWVGSVAYVGNHGTKLNTSDLDINQVPESELGQGPTATPYPLFGTISGSTNNAISNYNALQGVLNKRLTYGLQLNINYTWSHFLDDMDSSGWGSREGYQNYQNAYDISQNYSNSNFDIRQMFKGEAVYQLPFGRGKMFMNNANLALDEALGGWEISSTFMAEGGTPMGVTTGNDNTSGNLSGSYTQEAILTGNYKTGTSSGAYHSLTSWFNDSFDSGTPGSSYAFENPADYPNQFGTFRRNIIYGPDLTDVNFAAGKSFDLYPEKGIKFQFRAEATNILNHPSFAQPGPNTIGSSSPEQITGVTVGGREWEMVGHLTF